MCARRYVPKSFCMETFVAETFCAETLCAVLWIRNYFFRIRIWIWIPFSAEFWIRIPKKIVMDPDPDPISKKFRIRP
jgi:hypothetical protein